MPAVLSRYSFASLVIVFVTAGLARAQLQWDPGLTPATPSGGTGTWSALATVMNWSNGAADVAWDSNVAVFGGTAGTVTIDAGGVSATGLTFNTTGYTITGGTLTLTGTAPTITVGAATTDTAIISAPIAGTAGLTMAGPGTLTLSGANTYTGGTTINTGTVIVNAGSSLGSTTTPGALLLGNTAGTTAAAANVQFNTSATLASFQDTTNVSITNTMIIAAGSSVTVNGTFKVGPAINPAPTGTHALNTYTGTPVPGSGGTLTVNGAMTIGANVGGSANKPVAALDLQALSAFTLNAPTTTLDIGNGFNIGGRLTLASGSASANLINVTTINVGASGSSNATTGNQLNLGTGTNTIQTNTLNMGSGKSNGVLQFLGAGGTVSIAGTNGTGTTAITLGNQTSGTATSTATNFNVAGHQATISAGAVAVAQLNGSTGGTPTATMSFDTGTFNAASLAIGNDIGGTSTGGVNGTFTLGSSAASTGILNVGGTVSLVNVTSTQTAVKTDRATFTINGGTANIGGDIISNKVAAATGVIINSTLTLAGGTLNMTGHQIGHVTGTNIAVGTVSLVPTASQTATLMNLGGTGINDAGVNMNGAGTLILSGTNTYTGGTTLSSGQLNLNSATALGAATGGLTITGGALGNSSGSAVTLTNNNAQAWNADFAFNGPNDLNLGNGAVTMSASRIVTVNAGNLTVGGAVSDGGGAFTLTKAGTGTLTLGGANTYTGATSVNAGTLRLAPTLPYTAPAGFSVAGGQTPLAALNIVNSAGTSTLTVPTLALGGGGGSSALGFELATSSLPTAPLLTVSTANGLTLNGATHTINVTDTALPAPLGSFTLIAYNGTQITSGFALGTLPTPRTVANLDYATPGQIKLNITGVDSLIWSGALSSDWDVGTAVNVGGTNNWKLASNGNATNFVTGDVVSFLDTPAPATFNVNIATAVQPASVTVNTANTFTFSGPGSITGSAGLTKQGTGTLVLATDNTYAGGTTISAGTLQIGNGGTTGSVTGDVVDNGALAFNRSDNVTYAGNLSGTGTLTKAGTNTLTLTGTYGLGGNVTIAGGTLDLASPASYTLAATISGAGGLAKDGAGVLTLTGANTYSGPSAVLNGTLSVASLNSVSGGTASSNLGAPSAGNGSISLGSGTNSATLSYTGPGETTDRGINLAGTTGGGTIDQSGGGLLKFTGGVTATGAGAKTLTLTGAGNGEIAGVIANPGTGTTAVVKTGAGNWALSATNTYTGGTTLVAGGILPGADNALGTGPLTLGDTTANAFTLNFGTFNQTVAALNVITNSATANVLTVAPGKTLTATGNVTVGYTVANPATDVAVTKLTINGGGSFVIGSAASPVFVNIGPTQSGDVATRPVDTVDLSALASFSANATTFGVGNNRTTNATLTLSDTSNTITATTLNVAHSQGGNNGTSSMTFGAGTNTIKVDAINIGLSKAIGTIAFASQAAGSPGTVTITNAAGTGGANITLGFHNGTNTGNTPAGTLDLRGHVATVTAGTLTIANANTAGAGGATGTVSFDAGTFTVNTLNIATRSAAGTGTSNGTLNVGGGTFTVNAAFTLANFSGTGAGAASVGTVNVTGGTLTTTADIVTIGSTASITSTVNLNGGTLDLTGHFIGSSGNPVTNVTLQAGTLQNVADVNGGGAVSKTSAGTLVVNGTNTITGPITVSAGTLLVGGSSPSTATLAAPGGISVNGGTLGGHGTITGAITVPNGTLSPGASTGILTVPAAVTLSPTATLFEEINGPTTAGTQFDQINLTGGGTIDLSGANLTGTIGYSAQPSDQVTIISGGPVANQFASGTAFNFGGYSGTIIYNPTSVVLTNFTPVPVPEPVWVLAACGAVAGVARLRRRGRGEN